MKTILAGVMALAFLPVSALACSEDEIHQQTVACYNGCLQNLNESVKQQCIQQCVNDQTAARANCPGISCKIVSGMRICT